MVKRDEPLDKDNIVYLGRLIRRKRLGKGLTQGELGDLVGRSPGTISDIERGRGYFNYRTISAIASTLDIPMTEIFPLMDNRQRQKKGKNNDNSNYIDKTSLSDLLKVREIIQEQPILYLGNKELSKKARFFITEVLDMLVDRYQ